MAPLPERVRALIEPGPLAGLEGDEVVSGHLHGLGPWTDDG
jgi:hypothetical protein